MPKYLFHVNYLKQGTQELIDEGGTERMRAAELVMREAGGKLESMYFALGDTDAYVIGELPDNESAVSASLRVNARGAVSVRVTALLTADEMDAAASNVQQ